MDISIGQGAQAAITEWRVAVSPGERRHVDL